MLLAAAQVYRLVVAVLDMEADGVLVEGAALVEVDDIKHGVAAADDVEGGIEDVCRNGHAVSSDLARHSGAARRAEPGIHFPGGMDSGLATLRVAPE